MVAAARFSVWGVDLNPTRGSEQAGFRPVLVVSPDEMNNNLNTVIVAPMTTRQRGWPSRVSVRHDKKMGEVALDQLRTLDQARLTHPMGQLKAKYHSDVLAVLLEIFSEGPARGQV